MFRQILNRLATCMSSGLRVRCSRNSRFAALLRWRNRRRTVGIASSEATSSPEEEWGLWLLNQYDLDNRPYPEA